MLNHVLIAVAAGAGYAVKVLAWPLPRCPRCRGRRVIVTRGLRPGVLRSARCWLCHGTGRRAWPLTAQVHRLFWTLAGDRIRSRLRSYGRKDT